jgi:hypothetical protein
MVQQQNEECPLQASFSKDGYAESVGKQLQ